ncbi:phytanoyl-CoA dioxygenase family protein [Luteolibacter marinus]|uniref:phytanoyl-CoA dioxygenase family protein n=1 Tax=Luteolibacter marinus TaxID=2776705 RepID=UPI001867F5A1|nr:phytanoyl-CoA dioxygenase family protein [Luteolibacter marinus]
MSLDPHGWDRVPSHLPPQLLRTLRDEAFKAGSAGTRCLLDNPAVAEASREVKRRLQALGILPAAAVAIQAIAFNKTPEINWKVAWHQDLMFPFARPVSSPGYDLPSRKAGIDYARPPLAVLEDLLAARLHLDDCHDQNGPLRVSPGTHRSGIMSSDHAAAAGRSGEVTCLAGEGDLILMKPLALHASSPSLIPGNRRVLHLVYHSGSRLPEAWHRAL